MTGRRAAMAALAVAGAALLAWLVLREPTGGERPLATLRYLEADGARLLVVHDVAAHLVGSPTEPGLCRAQADRLQADVEPDDALALVAGVPDLDVQEAFMLERSAVGHYLTACAAGGAVDAATLRDATGRVDRELSNLGVRR